MIAEYTESVKENYTQLTIGDRVERNEGPLSDLAIRPMTISHQFGKKVLNFELSPGQDTTFCLKVNGRCYGRLMDGPEPDVPAKFYRSTFEN